MVMHVLQRGAAAHAESRVRAMRVGTQGPAAAPLPLGSRGHPEIVSQAEAQAPVTLMHKQNARRQKAPHLGPVCVVEVRDAVLVQHSVLRQANAVRTYTTSHSVRGGDPRLLSDAPGRAQAPASWLRAHMPQQL